MERIIFTLFILISSIACGKSQNLEIDTTDFFFSVAFDSLGECYGQCLLPAKFDTLDREIIIKHGISETTPIEHYQYDTIQLDFYYLHHGDSNIKYIINFVDTSSQLILVKEKSPHIVTSSYKTKDCFITVTEQRLKMPSFKNWELYRNKSLFSSNNWKLSNNQEVYETITKEVVQSVGCGGFPREKLTPAEYFTITKIIPSKNLKEHELNNIKLLCKKYYIRRKTKIKFENKIVQNKVTGIENIISLSKPARIEYKKISCNTNLRLISKIQKQLYALGFYSCNFQGELNDETKTAIIKYQVKNNLPIGQLDNETVEHILSRKTPFQN